VEEAVKGIRAAGAEALAVECNLMKNEDCKMVVDKHIAKFGTLNVLVNNAGKQMCVGRWGVWAWLMASSMCEDFKDIDLDNVQSTFQSNIIQVRPAPRPPRPAVSAADRGARAVLRGDKIRARAHEAWREHHQHDVDHRVQGLCPPQYVAASRPVLSLFHDPRPPARARAPADARAVDYSSTKGAIVTFTRSLAVQLAPKGIRVNGLAPGTIITSIQVASRPGEDIEELGVGAVPLHNRAGQPAEMGPGYVFLASSDSNAVTGQVLHMNSEWAAMGEGRGLMGWVQWASTSAGRERRAEAYERRGGACMKRTAGLHVPIYIRGREPAVPPSMSAPEPLSAGAARACDAFAATGARELCLPRVWRERAENAQNACERRPPG
jgi:NAD(P)-dependent dehydrogenase (short-subunit alcohol dehydrogenase family)